MNLNNLQLAELNNTDQQISASDVSNILLYNGMAQQNMQQMKQKKISLRAIGFFVSIFNTLEHCSKQQKIIFLAMILGDNSNEVQKIRDLILHTITNCLKKTEVLENSKKDLTEEINKFLQYKDTLSLSSWEKNYINDKIPNSKGDKKITILQEYLVLESTVPYINGILRDVNIIIMHNMHNDDDFTSVLRNLSKLLIKLPEALKTTLMTITDPNVTQMMGELFLRILAAEDVHSKNEQALETLVLKQDPKTLLNRLEKEFYIQNRETIAETSMFNTDISEVFHKISGMVVNTDSEMTQKATDMCVNLINLMKSHTRRETSNKYPITVKTLLLFWLQNFSEVNYQTIKKIMDVDQVTIFNQYLPVLECLFNLQDKHKKIVFSLVRPVSSQNKNLHLEVFKNLKKLLDSNTVDFINTLRDNQTLKLLNISLNTSTQISDKNDQTASEVLDYILRKNLYASGRERLYSYGNSKPRSLTSNVCTMFFNTAFSPKGMLKHLERAEQALEKALEKTQTPTIEEFIEESDATTIQNLDSELSRLNIS